MKWVFWLAALVLFVCACIVVWGRTYAMLALPMGGGAAICIQCGFDAWGDEKRASRRRHPASNR